MTPRETNADSDSPVRSSINVPPDLVVGLLGSADENLRALESILTADIHVRGNVLTLSGEPADVAGVLWLLSLPESAYMNGSDVLVDGGMFVNLQ